MDGMPKKWRWCNHTYHRVATNTYKGDTVVTWRRWSNKHQRWDYGASTEQEILFILTQIEIDRLTNTPGGR